MNTQYNFGLQYTCVHEDTDTKGGNIRIHVGYKDTKDIVFQVSQNGVWRKNHMKSLQRETLTNFNVLTQIVITMGIITRFEFIFSYLDLVMYFGSCDLLLFKKDQNHVSY